MNIIIANPVISCKALSIGVNATIVRRNALENIIDRCLFGSKYEPHRDTIHRAVQIILFAGGCLIWYTSDIIKANAALIALGLTVKLIGIAYKRFTVKAHAPLAQDNQAVYKNVINLIASYSSSLREVIAMKQCGYPINQERIREVISQSNDDDMKELARDLKITHATDKEQFNQLIQFFFRFASMENQERLYSYFNFLEDLADYPSDAELGRDLLKALPFDMTEFSLIPHSKEQDWLLVIERCKHLQRFTINF
ncbi:MAG: hypothetical protein H0W88_01880 [Parachlamydiaceae bacterium]|nr:hypothetical protein [Parachlamydiaceae bacterium]